MDPTMVRQLMKQQGARSYAGAVRPAPTPAARPSGFGAADLAMLQNGLRDLQLVFERLGGEVKRMNERLTAIERLVMAASQPGMAGLGSPTRAPAPEAPQAPEDALDGVDPFYTDGMDDAEVQRFMDFTEQGK